MNFQKPVTLSLLSGCLVAFSGLSARADTSETTQTTTTVTSATPSAIVNLPVTGSYVVVDPITGQIQGNYDAAARLVDGSALHTGVVIVNQTDGGPVGFVDASGNIVDVTSYPASPTLLVSIDARRKDLDSRINEALNRGLLTPAKATAFRAELERIAADEQQDRVGGVVSYTRALQLGYGLNTLSDRLMPISNTVAFQPVIAPQFVYVDGHLTLLDTIDYRKHHLSTRCDDEYAAGRLSAQQVSKLKEGLSKISSTERRYTKNGTLSSSKDRKLSEQLDQLQAQMDSDVASINQKRTKIGIRVD